MDLRRWGEESWQSVRICREAELWVPAGAVLAAVCYALWIGLSGAAVSFLADAALGGLQFEPWGPTATMVTIVLAILWVVGPAAVAVVLVVDRLHNVRDNLRTPYRLQHPSLLLVPPILVLLAVVGALAVTGEAGTLALVVLVGGTAWLVLRTIAYSHRVFALSVPVYTWWIGYVTAIAGLVAVLVGSGLAVGREAELAAVSGWLSRILGYPPLASAHTATVDVAGAPVPLVVAIPVVLGASLCTLYVGCQTVAGILARVRRPDVRRPELRTGQRYPDFARPTTDATPEPIESGSGKGPVATDGAPDATVVREPSGGQTPTGSGSSAPGRSGRPDTSIRGSTASRTGAPDPDRSSGSDGGRTPGAGVASDGSPSVDTAPDHTRVYSPPDHATVDDGDDADAADPDWTDCPDCGTDLGRADVCPTCGAEVDSA